MLGYFYSCKFICKYFLRITSVNALLFNFSPVKTHVNAHGTTYLDLINLFLYQMYANLSLFLCNTLLSFFVQYHLLCCTILKLYSLTNIMLVGKINLIAYPLDLKCIFYDLEIFLISCYVAC